MRRPWVSDEIDVLQKHYRNKGVKYCSKVLGRSCRSIYGKAFLLGLNRSAVYRWSEQENNILKQYYPDYGVEYCDNLLNRSQEAIKIQASKLGLRTHFIQGRWTMEENNTLIKYYSQHGCKYCADQLNRSSSSISHQSQRLGLATTITNGNVPKKQIIEKLEENKVIALCQKHGETPHYFRNGKIRNCIQCHSYRMKILSQTDRMKECYRASREKERATPLGLYKHRLRRALRNAFQYSRYLQDNNIKKRRGCFRHLLYSPQQLCDYLETIKRRQDDKCPVCRRSYNITGFDIDHIIPLVTAQTEVEMLKLFDLNNLSLLCPKCNGSKGPRILTSDQMKEMGANGY